MENHKENPEEQDKQDDQINTYLIPSRKKLYRSPYNYVLFGICGGISEYIKINPVLLRILFVATSLLGGWGIVAYLMCFVLVPEHPSMKEKGLSGRLFTRRALGFVMIGTGVYFWMPPFGIFNYLKSINVSESLFLSSMVVVGGIIILLRGLPSSGSQVDRPKKLFRSVRNRRLVGVCAGLAEYLQTDVNLIRLLFILLSFLTLGVVFIFYLVVGYFIPPEETTEAADA